MKKMFFFALALLISTVARGQSTNEIEELTKRLDKQQKQIDELEQSSKKSWTRNLKVSGYLQNQWQMASQEGQVAEHSDNAFDIRRARVKVSYKRDYFSSAIQINGGLDGVSLVEATANFHLPNEIFEANMGLVYLPFTYYLDYSSSARKAPEMPNVVTSLVPYDTGLGAHLKLSGKRDTELSKVDFALGAYSMNGKSTDFSTRKRILSRLQYNTSYVNGISWGVVGGYQNGGILNLETASFVYNKGEGYESKDVQGKYSTSQYCDLGGKFSIETPFGKTALMGEYLFGTQVGFATSNKTIKNEDQIASMGSVYSRPFGGYYVNFEQQIAKTNLTLLVRYDRYDPNRKVSATEIGVLTGTGVADVALSTLGTGLCYDFINGHFRVLAYYEFNMNEKTPNLGAYAQEIKDNLFTLRLQVKF